MNKNFQASWWHKQIFSDVIGLKIIFIIIIIIIIIIINSIFTPLQPDFFLYLVKYKPVPVAARSKA